MILLRFHMAATGNLQTGRKIVTKLREFRQKLKLFSRL